MVKYKARLKDGRLLVSVKLSGEHTVNERELGSFAQLGLRGFLRPSVRKQNVLEYSGPVGISLRERMNSPISKYEFFFIVEEIVAAVQLLQNKKLTVGCVVWDLNCTYYNQMTKELLLLYLPLTPHRTDVNLTDFLESLIYAVTPIQGETADYISDFRFFLYSLSSFSPERIESYVASAAPEAVSAIKRYKGSPSGFIAHTQVESAHHERERGWDQGGTDMPLSWSGGTSREAPETTLLDTGSETELLTPDDTALLFQDDGTAPLDTMAAPNWPTLERVRTGEQIIISKPSFRLGARYGSVDGYLGNNIHISSRHVEIINRGVSCFAKDLGSTNKTRLNGAVLSPMQEAELHSGDVLTLADEDFIFRY